MNIATKDIKEQQILILSEDSKSFFDYLIYFLTQHKVNKQKKNEQASKILAKIKNKAKNRLEFYISNPKNSQQLKITIYHPGSNAQTIINTAKNIRDNKKNCFDRIYCVFDYVFENKHKDNHEQYKRIISQKEELEKKNIFIINSVPSYEYWLLTHLKQCNKNLSDDELKKELEDAIKIDYEKNNSHLFEKLFQDNYKEILEYAISRCKKQDEYNKQHEVSDDNPSSQIYKMIEYIKDFLE